MTDLTPDAAYRQAQAVEYGSLVANKPIFIDGARAFNEGDPVPVSHVERGVVLADDVTSTSTTSEPAPAEQKPTTTEPKPKADATTPKEG